MDNNHPHHRHRSVTVVAGTPGPVSFHQYACITCRSRKVKCNRAITGCAECKRAKVQCIYSPRRSRKSQKTKQLIGVRPLAPVQRGADDGTTRLQIEKLSINPHDDSSHEDHIHEFSCQSSIDARQLNRDGGDRNVSDSSSPNSEQLGPATLKETLDGSFLFNTQNSKVNVRSYHPSPRLKELLWKHYVDNVDILVKILYKPAVEALVMSASKELGKIDASTEALLFATVCY